MGPSDGAEGQRASRAYRSPLRQQKGADTKRRIASAAQELFAEGGFRATTVAKIAERAGVAVPTVYATFGSKGAVARALLTQMEAGADVAGWAARIADESDPHRKLAAFAQWTTALFSSSKIAIQAANGAAEEPEIIELRDEGNKQRRAGLRGVISSLAELNALRKGLGEERALDRAWMLTGVELYLNATTGCGWSDEEYALWLAALLQEQLLSAGPSLRP